MHALLDGCAGTRNRRPPLPPPAVRAILPMAELDGLPAETRSLLVEIAAALVGPEEPVLVPSLLRHFAHDQDLLSSIRDLLCPRAAELAERSAAIASKARALAAGLPHPVDRLADGRLRRVAARFVDATASLLVAGEVIRSALAAAPNDEGPADAGPSRVAA
jgi:hypothetical protein